MKIEPHGKGDLEKLPHICSFITTFTSSLCPSLECCRVVQVLQNKKKKLITDVVMEWFGLEQTLKIT